jgi:receptor protein-tyrosine kinase
LDDVFTRELSSLRASIEQILPDYPQRTLLIAGSLPGEGSSTVAARFSQLLAEDSRMRVALIDADFRNAEARTVPAVERGHGLASVLGGSLAPGRAFRATSRDGLDILPSEGVTPDPYVLCTPEHTGPFIDFVRGQYHYALLDAAPVLSAPETSVLAGSVDGVVLVVRAGRTKREAVQRAIERLRDRGARVLGVVMNRQQYVIPEFIYRRL